MVRAWCCLLAALVLVFASVAAAEDKARGRKLFEEAGAEFVAESFVRAEELYAQSYAAYPAPTALFWQGRALDKLDRLIEARECYRKAAAWALSPDDPPAFGSTVAQAKLALFDIEKEIPAIVITVDDPEATVTIDGRQLPPGSVGERMPVDPGPHLILVAGKGYEAVRRDVVAERGRTADVSIAVPRKPDVPDEEPGPPPMLIAGIVVAGVGAVSLIVWGVTGALYLDREATVEEHCDAVEGQDGNIGCDAEGLEAASDGKTLGIVNTVALFVGIGGAGVGVALIILGLSSEESAWRIDASPNHAGLVWSGRF